MYERKVVPPPAAARDAIAAGPGQAPNGPAAPRPSPAPGVGGPGLARVQQGQRAGPWPALTRRGRRSQVRPPPCLSGSGPGTLRPAASVTRRCRPSRVQPKLGHHKECAVCAPLPQTGKGRSSSLLHGVLSVSEPGRAPTRQDASLFALQLQSWRPGQALALLDARCRPAKGSEQGSKFRGKCRDPACELPAAVDVCRQLSRTGALRGPDALRRAPPAQPAPAPAPARAEARPERAHGAAAVPPASAAHQVRHDGGPVCPAGCMHGVAFISFSLVVRQPGKQPAGACSGLAVLAHAAGAAERFLVQGAQHHSWLTPMAGG